MDRAPDAPGSEDEWYSNEFEKWTIYIKIVYKMLIFHSVSAYNMANALSGRILQ